MKRKFVGLILLGIMLLAAPAWAGVFESLTIMSAAAVGLTSTTYAPSYAQRANECACTLETAQIRFRTDGTSPTTAEGHILNAGDTLKIYDEQINRLKGIAVSTTATLKCTCDYKER